MIKWCLIILLLTACLGTRAQSTDTAAVFDSYVDLNVAMLEGSTDDARNMAENILADTLALPVKARTSYYNILGKLYEDDQRAEAIKYYSRVAAAVPDYYVVHRALGYLYVKAAEEAERSNAKQEMLAAIAKALPHLEKAEACDPSPETRELILSLYKKSGKQMDAATLTKRLTVLSKNCVDILDTQ